MLFSRLFSHCSKLIFTQTDINYHVSDQTVIDIVKKAKSLLEPDAVAADVIHLARCIIEYEADVNHVAQYMVKGLVERSVFEFAKKKIASNYNIKYNISLYEYVTGNVDYRASFTFSVKYI